MDYAKIIEQLQNQPPERTIEERLQAEVEWSERLLGKRLCGGPSQDNQVLLIFFVLACAEISNVVSL